MKKLILMTMAALLSVPVLAQDDDLYFTPKKDATVKAAKETYYSGSDRNVDEYNRRGNYRQGTAAVDDSDVVFFDDEKGEYPDSVGNVKRQKSYSERYNDIDDDDYTYSRELNRWYGFYDPWLCSRFYGWYSPFYSPFYSWYDPWYYPYYGGWYGYYNPWYYSYYGGWYDPWWHGGPHYAWHVGPAHHGFGGVGAGYSNRGHVNTSAGAGTGYANRGTARPVGGNVYNDIAKRNQSSRQIVSSSRTVGSRQVGTNTNSSRSTFSQPYRSSGNSSTFSSGGSRGFSGGGFGGGSRGGGFSGGGGRGGRR